MSTSTVETRTCISLRVDASFSSAAAGGARKRRHIVRLAVVSFRMTDLMPFHGTLGRLSIRDRMPDRGNCARLSTPTRPSGLGMRMYLQSQSRCMAPAWRKRTIADLRNGCVASDSR